MTTEHKPKIGFALGGGAARGWAHFGIINALQEQGIKPDIICGTSIGALVGATYVTGKMDDFEQWTRKLRKRDIAGLMDFTLGSGLIEGERLMKFFHEQLLGKDMLIEELSMPYAAVATELATGNEIWFQHGSLLSAVRASISLPGLFAPVYLNNKWLADGALVNPVPVSVCRALGAEFVIAIDLNSRQIGKPFRRSKVDSKRQSSNGLDLKSWYTKVIDKMFENNKNEPGFFDVLSSSIYIMQDRITRSRMAGDPPDILLRPDLSDIELMDFDQAARAIDKGAACVKRLSHLFESLS